MTQWWKQPNENMAQNIKFSGRTDEPLVTDTMDHCRLQPIIPRLLPTPFFSESNGVVRFKWHCEYRLDWALEFEFDTNNPHKCSLSGPFVPSDVLLTSFEHNKDVLEWRWDSLACLTFWTKIVLSNK